MSKEKIILNLRLLKKLENKSNEKTTENYKWRGDFGESEQRKRSHYHQ